MTIARNNSGVAFVMMLMFMTVLVGISTVFVLRTVGEIRTAGSERDNMNAFYVSQGGSQAALRQLDVLINTYLMNTIAASSPSGVISYANGKVNSGDGVGWLVYTVRNANTPVLTQNGEQAEYAGSGTLGSGSYVYTIIMTEKSDPASAGSEAWDFPYNYQIDVAGTSGDNTSNVIIYGDFTVRVQKDNFAKFALFTNSQTAPDGSNVWFTDKTNFSGPVHTNARFNFALNPSGAFTAGVTQVETHARFYNNGSPVLLNADHNGTRDVPVFGSTFTRGASSVSLSSSTDQTQMADQASGGQSFGSNGIYVPTSGGAVSGGIYIRGDASVTMAVDGSGHAQYTIAQGGTTKTITVDRVNNQTSVTSGASTSTYNGIPDGVDDAGTLIYATGSISSLGGTVQQDTALTVASGSNIVISDHVRYANYTAASGTPGTNGYVPPSAEGTDNLLGLVSWNGNVNISTSAPDDIEIHGSILAQNGVFQVTNYSDTGLGPRGTATLLGGVISDDYGAFGQFNGATGQQTSGYGRNFVYDNRMEEGSAPPYFPSLNTFIAFTNDLTDKLVWQEGE